MPLLVKQCMTLHNFFPHPSLCLVNKMSLLKKLLSSFNPRRHLFLCLQPWFGETAPPELNRCFRIFSSTINWRQIILQKKSKIPIIQFFSILLNMWCLLISLGVQDNLVIGNEQYSLVRRLINYQLWDDKDVE